ncbi:hypothetical protein [Streptomyces sp. SP2-10]|uniref:hypothetical protein n=1 Tax=unclassified Streptomyces TaxID=2593676 RepID=UPI001CA5F6E2|nr:hypothetical protein [Streptomyces sp. SP2-10]MBY8841914.1 hypothetical protein [Streptomyces sp. SP2-10]
MTVRSVPEAVEIELVEGAADGRRLPVCGDPMNPPAELKVAEPTPLGLDPGALTQDVARQVLIGDADGNEARAR